MLWRKVGFFKRLTTRLALLTLCVLLVHAPVYADVAPISEPAGLQAATEGQARTASEVQSASQPAPDSSQRLAQLPTLSGSASYDIPRSLVEIQKIDSEVIGRICDIFKANTALRTEFGRNPRFHRWIMMVAQTANYFDTFAGLMINMIYNLYWSAHGGSATIPAQEAATVPRFIGKAFFLSTLTVEIVREIREHNREVKAGFDPTTTMRRIVDYNNQIDALLKTREAMLHDSVSALTPEEYHAADTEGKVLRQGQALANSEFAMLYSRARSISARNKFYNIETWIKKADATFGADLTRIIAGATQNRYLNGPAAISTTLSGMMSATGVYGEMYTRHKSYTKNHARAEGAVNEISNGDLAQFGAERQQFERAALQIDPARMPLLSNVYTTNNQTMQSLAAMVQSLRMQREEELHHQRMHDLHSIVYHAAYGGSKWSRGAWLIYVGFHYLRVHHIAQGPNNTPTEKILNAYWAKSQRTTYKQRVSLINGYAGIDNFAGSAYRILDYLTWDVLQVIHRKRDNINRQADSALIRSRWDLLDSIQDDTARSTAALSAAATH